MNKRIVHDALILTAFTLVLGFILALVQGITAEPIDKANKAAAQKAYQAVFSDAKSFEKYDYDADEADKLVSDAGYKDTIDDIETALDSNKETLGYVITVTAKDGSQDGSRCRKNLFRGEEYYSIFPAWNRPSDISAPDSSMQDVYQRDIRWQIP